MTLLQNTKVTGMGHRDVRLDSGRIHRMGEPHTLKPEADEEVLVGGWLTPPLAEPHCHLDAAFLGRRAPNVSGTLREGIENWSKLRPTLTYDDVITRARRALALYAEHGCFRVRTHVDSGHRVAVQALVDLARDPGPGMSLQVVAFPQEGILRAPGRKTEWEEAVALGCDAVGAIPHFERTMEEGFDSVRLAFALAEKHGVQVDLHCDETDDPGSRNLEVVCAETLDRSMSGQVIAGHCTALHSYSNPHAAKVIELVAMSGVQVVCNPLDNAVLQGRYDQYPKRRGLTRVDELWAAGASVGVGHDSIQDPWYPLGRGSMLDATHMMIHLCHLSSQAQMERAIVTLFSENHRCFGGPPVMEEGPHQGLLWWEQQDAVDLLTARPKPRCFV